MTSPYSILVAGHTFLAWIGSGYGPLGHSHPLQNLHEDSARVLEGLHHHMGGPGHQPLTDEGYVME